MSWMLATACTLHLYSQESCNKEPGRNDTSVATFQSDMAKIEQAISIAEAGDVHAAAKLLCAGQEPEKAAWMAVTAAGRLNERDRYNEATRLAEEVLKGIDALSSNQASHRHHKRARYWASRLYMDVLDRPEAAEQVLGPTTGDTTEDADLTVMRTRARVRSAAKLAEKGDHR